MSASRHGFFALLIGGLLTGNACNAWPQTTAEKFAHLPLAFERQPGSARDRFVARGQGYVAGVEKGKVSIEVVPRDQIWRTVSLEFAGSKSSHGVPESKLPGKVNYLQGNDRRKWRIGLPTYARVAYPDTYPGIDVVYYGNQQQLEFDLIVKPGADPDAIRLKIGGGGKLSLDDSGAIVLVAAGGLRVALPLIYQEMNGVRKSVPGHYVIAGRDEVALHIDSWDRSRPLVIDPAIVYSTLLGGTFGSSQGQGIALDASGNMYVTGYTSANDFPVVNASQGSLNANPEGFVTEINAAGTAFLYSTYIGGSGDSQLQAIAVDSTGAAWVAGFTGSKNFPVVNPVQSTFGGASSDAILLKLDPAGVPVFSTFLGGSSNDSANGVAVDGSNNAYVTGYSFGPFPTTAGVFQSVNNGNPALNYFAGASNAFVAKFTSSGSELYATFLGGTDGEAGYGIAADAAGNAYVTGSSASPAIPNAPTGGAQSTNAGGGDAFIAKLNPTGTALVYFTLLGGAAADRGNAIAVDAAGDAYIAGLTASTGLATAGVAQTAPGGRQ